MDLIDREQTIEKVRAVADDWMCDMLNNALRFIRDGQTEEACEEIIFAIEKADGYFHEDIISFVEEVRGARMVSDEDKH